MGAGSRVARRRDRGRLGASVHALKPDPGTSQALEAGDARDASSSELPGIEEPVTTSFGDIRVYASRDLFGQRTEPTPLRSAGAIACVRKNGVLAVS